MLQGQFAVLANYFNVGALWLSDPANGSAFPSAPGSGQSQNPANNQRGSLRLANTVAETVHQNVDFSENFVSNCFGCHQYSGTSQPAKNTTSGNLSHIFDDIVTGQGFCLNTVLATVEAKDVLGNCSAAKH